MSGMTIRDFGPAARRRARTPLAALAALSLLGAIPGCGVQRHVAESAVIDVVADYAMIRDHVQNLAPDQARSIEAAIEAAKRTLDRGDLEATLVATRDIQARTRELSDRLPLMRGELESAWNELSASLPGTLASLSRRLSLANRPAGGTRQAAFDSARVALPVLMAQWRESQAAMHNGRLAESVSRAEVVRDRAKRVMADVQKDS